MDGLSTSLWGLSLRNPIIIAPSPPTAHASGIIAADRAGAGAVITKSVGPHTERPTPGTDRRQVRYVPGTGIWMQSTYRREILPLAEGRELLLSVKPRVAIPVIGSVFCPSFDPVEWTRVAGALAEAGADAIHLDLFYLPLEPPLAAAGDGLRSLFNAVVADVHVPVVVKLNIHLDLAGVVRICEETGVRGLAYLDSARLGNPRSEHDPASYLLPGPPSEMCGLAGEWLRPMTMAYTDRLQQLTHLERCAGGGLFDSHDALEALLRGAHAIQLCTALLVRGWGVVREILDGLKSYLIRTEGGSLTDLREECRLARTSPLVGRVQRVPGVCVQCGRCEAQFMCRARAGSAECESCGFCVELCPVGAVLPR
jgi:dihydropyrimidine dehydrogenase (NAD+) subunit PreA